MSKLIRIAALSYFCIASPIHAAASPDGDIAEASQHFKDILTLTSNYTSDTAHECTDRRMKLANTMLQIIEALSGVYQRSLEPDDRGNYSNVQLREMLRATEALNEVALQSTFEIADTFKKVGCLDDADQLYRRVQSQYVGSAYVAQRERAATGIEDIRALRAK
jgi:hypothetical protein